MADPVKVYSLVDEGDQDALKALIEDTYKAAGTGASNVRTAAQVELEGESDTGGVKPGEIFKMPPVQDLIGIDPAVYRQINAAVNSGKQHLMFFGPPGTGKTTLARRVANEMNGSKWTLVTGSADWSSQDIIGGYQPLSGGTVMFFKGVLLRNFDRPLVIDELNRCDIDKVIGPLFTVLSGHSTTLPYRVKSEDPLSPQYIILPEYKADPAEHEVSPGLAWRLIATINSIDKASLYQMSYALSRRFGWIYVDAPKDKKQFVQDYLEKLLKQEPRVVEGTPPLSTIWDTINAVRVIGPAPVIDAINALEKLSPGSDLLLPPTGELQIAYLDVFDLFMLPMLDGILRHEAEAIAGGVITALGLQPEGDEATRLKGRLRGVAV